MDQAGNAYSIRNLVDDKAVHQSHIVQMGIPGWDDYLYSTQNQNTERIEMKKLKKKSGLAFLYLADKLEDLPVPPGFVSRRLDPAAYYEIPRKLHRHSGCAGGAKSPVGNR